MKFSTYCAICVATLAGQIAAAPTSTSSTSTTPSPSSTCFPKRAKYDGVPVQPQPTDFYLKQLQYENFQVVAANPAKTFYQAKTSPNMLALKKGEHGVIRVAPNNQYNENDYFFPGEFFGGCARLSTSGVAERVNCSVSFATPEVEYGGELITISTAYGAYYPPGRALERGEWGGPSTPYINVTLYDGPKGAVYYLDSLQYSVNCIFCEKDFICS